MLKFSETAQGFYDTDFNYQDLPNDLVIITSTEQHMDLLQRINEGRRVFMDLTFSEPRPSKYHVWVANAWEDTDTPEAKQERRLLALTPLTRRQFMLALVHYDLDEVIETKIDEIEDISTRKIVKIEYKESTTFVRTSPSIQTLAQILNLTDEQLNGMWEQALTY